MEVKLTKSVVDSLENLALKQSLIYKTYDFFKYDLPRFIRNIWRFRQALYSYSVWDHHGVLKFMEAGLTGIAVDLENNGKEIDLPRNKKIAKIRRAVELLNNYTEDSYIELAESELGKISENCFTFKETSDGSLLMYGSPDEESHAKKVFARARDIEREQWDELWQIIKGQDYAEYVNLYNSLSDEEKNDSDHYYKWFDGSDLRGWWN